jgi:uncharacterized protein YciI
MPDEFPPGLTVETVWVIEASYSADAAQRRAPVRNEHIERLGRLRAEGVVLEVGGYYDMSGSLMIVRAASEEEALAIAKSDVYTRAGVWTGYRARQMGRVSRLDEVPAQQG